MTIDQNIRTKRQFTFLRDILDSDNLDFILDCIYEGSLRVRGQFCNRFDYYSDCDPQERPALEKIDFIPVEEIADMEFNYKNGNYQHNYYMTAYMNVKIENKALHKALNNTTNNKGAPQKYKWEEFYKELIIDFHENGIAENHERWCNDLYQRLTFLDDKNGGPSLITLKRKTQQIWDRLNWDR